MFFIVVKADNEPDRYLAADKHYLYWTEHRERMLLFLTFEEADSLAQEVLGMQPENKSRFKVHSNAMMEMALRLSITRIESKGRLLVVEAKSLYARHYETRLNYTFKQTLDLSVFNLK